MKRLLFIHNNLKGGGAEKYLVSLLKEIDKTKFYVEILLISEYGLYVEEINKDYKINYLFSKKNILTEGFILKKKYLRKILTLFRILVIKYFYTYTIEAKIKQNKFDTVISFIDGPPTGIVRKLNKVKKIAWIHSDCRRAKTYYTKKENLENYKNVNKIICVSKSSENSFLELYPNYISKTEVIYNFINKDEIIEKSLEKVSYRKNKLLLIAIGRLTKEKNHMCLLEACKKLKEENVDFELIILGAGNKREEYNKYIIRNKLEENIKLYGFIKNPYPYLKEADIFILPSLYEGYPLVLCEAMVLNKFIICSDFEAGKEILKEGEYGILFKNNDVQDLYIKLKKYIFLEEKRITFQEKLKKINWEENKRKILKKIEEIL